MGKSKRRHQFHRSTAARPDTGSRSASRSVSHWLGEGESGQNSLLVDLDPYLYSADQIICKNASQIAQHYDGLEERPLAVILSPAERIPWHMGYLRSRFFDVAVVTEENDPLLDEAAERFNVSVFYPPPPRMLEGQADFLLMLESHWPDPLHVQAALKEAHRLLSDEGRAVLLFEGEILDGEGYIVWSDGTRRGLGEIANDYIMRDFSGYQVDLVPLVELNRERELGVSDFLKRHRDFFGKNTRELFLSRFREGDFDQVRQPGSTHAVIALTVFLHEI